MVILLFTGKKVPNGLLIDLVPKLAFDKKICGRIIDLVTKLSEQNQFPTLGKKRQFESA